MLQNISIKSVIPDYVGAEIDMFSHIIRIFLHTDAGAEIDDEIGIGWFLNWLINRHSKVNIHLVISVKTGVTGIKRLIDFGLTPFTNVNLNPTWGFENVIPIVGTNNTITLVFHDGITFVPDNYRMHYIGSISPGLDNVIKSCNLSELIGFSHQGLLGDPGWYGFNESGGTEMLRVLKNSGLPFKVAKPLDCFRDFLFSRELFEYYGIPECLWKIIAGDAFKNIIGRMPPTVPDHVKPLFATLVNLELADKYGKPGTNKRLADAIRGRYTGTIMHIDDATHINIMTASIAYVDSFPNEDRDGTIKSVYDLTFELAEMGMPFLHNTTEGYRLIYSSDGNLAEIYSEAFERFYMLGIFTPAYDLKALCNLKDLLIEHNAV